MELTVNELLRALTDAVDPIDRNHVKVRLLIHSHDGPTGDAYARSISGGTGYPFVNIVGEVDNG